MSRARATILFTDVVESTAVAAALGDAAWATVIRAHDVAVRACVARHGGSTIETTGDGVLATFLSPGAAVRAAADALAAVGPLGLQLRAGLHTGDVEVDGERVVGLAVHLASRVVALAVGGEVLVSGTVRDLVAGSGLGFTDRGMFELRGFAEPWRLFALTVVVPASTMSAAHRGPDGAAAPPAVEQGRLRLPLPPGIARVPRVPTVGRDGERDQLEAAWARAVRGRSCAVLLGGEPGVGKTRLTEELARHAHSTGGVVLVGRCDPGLGMPHQPFAEALVQLSHAVPAEELRPLLGPHAAELSRLVPELPDLLPGLAPPTASAPGTERWRLLRAVAGWLAATAEAAPLLLVLEDVHWADEATLLVLHHLLGRVEGSRVCLLVTHREAAGPIAGRVQALLAEAARTRGCRSVRLAGLDADGMAAFVAAAAGQALDDAAKELAARLHHESGGNPFLAGELLRHLAMSETLARDDVGNWSVARRVDRLPLPEAVRDALAQRFSSLAPRTREVLQAAAVIGWQFREEVLAAVVGEHGLDDALEEARVAGLLDEVVTRDSGQRLVHRFRHALLSTSLYDGQSVTRRARRHAAIAGVLSAGPRDATALAELAHHHELAAPVVGAGAGVRAHQLAGEAALAAAPEVAVGHFVRAQELARELPDAERDAAARVDMVDMVDIARGLAQARHRAGDPAYTEALAAAAVLARALGDPDRLAAVALACPRESWSPLPTDSHGRDVLLADALAGLPVTAGDGVRARLLAELAEELIWDPAQEHRLKALTDEALATARRLGDPVTLTVIIARRLSSLWGLAHAHERDALAEEGLELAAEVGDPVLQLHCAAFGLLAAVECGRVERVEPLHELLERLLPTVGHAFWTYATHYPRAVAAAVTGTPAQMLERTSSYRDLGRRLAVPETEFVALCGIGAVAWWRDTYDEVDPELLDLLEVTNELPTMRAWQAAILARRGDTARAQQLIDGFTDGGFALPADHSQGLALAECALATADLGDRRAAAVLLAVLAPYTDLVLLNPVNAAGPVPRFQALLLSVLGRAAEADAAATVAVLRCERAGARMWLAHTLVERAEARAAAGLPGVRVDAARAQALATELGLPGIARRAAAVLGARVERLARA